MNLALPCHDARILKPHRTLNMQGRIKEMRVRVAVLETYMNLLMGKDPELINGFRKTV
jgi:hypothetical protein